MSAFNYLAPLLGGAARGYLGLREEKQKEQAQAEAMAYRKAVQAQTEQLKLGELNRKIAEDAAQAQRMQEKSANEQAALGLRTELGDKLSQYRADALAQQLQIAGMVQSGLNSRAGAANEDRDFSHYSSLAHDVYMTGRPIDMNGIPTKWRYLFPTPEQVPPGGLTTKLKQMGIDAYLQGRGGTTAADPVATAIYKKMSQPFADMTLSPALTQYLAVKDPNKVPMLTKIAQRRIAELRDKAAADGVPFVPPSMDDPVFLETIIPQTLQWLDEYNVESRSAVPSKPELTPYMNGLVTGAPYRR